MTGTMVGGVGNMQEVDEEVKSMIMALQTDVETKAGKSFAKFEPTHFASQVVAGVNYFVKVNVGEDFLHLRVFKPLPHTGEAPQLHSFQEAKTLEDPLSHF
eukprot:GFYU01000019.1.p2 GENE.GFYU01000019.1~~GFYU01000019.1.p2  ORF type:complete len:101 (-),score=34.48 GFYU01000019.1:69-371(-)